MKKKKMKNDELPLSLIESNILPRLPAKSVGRCMCVCKQWKSFLSTPMFAQIHLRHVTINDYKLLLLDGLSQVIFRTLDCEPLYNGLRTVRSKPSPDPSAGCIIASLNGLVCLAGRPFKLSSWNPLTGAYKRLSSLPDYPFFSLNCNDVVGFYTDSSNDYKLLYLINGARNGAYIYSSRLDSWRKIDFSVGTVCSERPQYTLCGQFVYFKASHRWIICFDVKTEKSRKIQCPPAPGGAKSYHRSLVVLHGCIHLCVSYTIIINDIRWMHGDIWRMDGDDGWVKVAAFNDPQPLH
ncbi:putative F-box domain, galactose oxidase/kelch, beta-propeller, F-box associated interaction [Helianthus debilis subsp. tardiflorus]